MSLRVARCRICRRVRNLFIFRSGFPLLRDLDGSDCWNEARYGLLRFAGPQSFAGCISITLGGLRGRNFPYSLASDKFRPCFALGAGRPLGFLGGTPVVSSLQIPPFLGGKKASFRSLFDIRMSSACRPQGNRMSTWLISRHLTKKIAPLIRRLLYVPLPRPSVAHAVVGWTRLGISWNWLD